MSRGGSSALSDRFRCLLVLALLVACSDLEAPVVDQRPVYAESFESKVSEDSIEFSLAGTEEARRWKLRSGVEASRVTPEGLALTFVGNDPHLSREVVPRLRNVSWVEIETAEPVRSWRIYLRVQGEESGRFSIGTTPSPDDPRIQRAVLQAATWRGVEVEELRLDPHPDTRTVTLKRAALGTAVAGARFRIGDESRECTRGSAVVSTLQGPPGTAVRVGVAGIHDEVPDGEHGVLRGALRDAMGRVVSVIEQGISLERRAWIDVRTVLPPAQPPFELELGTYWMPSGTELESCFERPDIQIAPAGPRPPNVLLVSLDTFRADHIQHAPFLSRLASEGLSFRRVWASSNWTLPSHVSLMTSLPVLEHQVPAVGARAPYPGARVPQKPTLAQVLRDAGYLTAATTEAGFVHDRYGFADGFDRFRAFDSTELAPGVAAHRHTEFLRDLLSVRGPKPFFVFLHSFKLHDYFLNTPEYQEHLAEGLREWGEHESFSADLREGRTSSLPRDYLQQLYVAGVRRVDEILDSVVTMLRRETGDAPLIVIVVSDHGESFAEHPDVWHHGSAMVEEQLRVPLVVWSNDDPALRGEVAVETSLIDVAPSLLRYLDLEVPETFRGESDRFTRQPSSERQYPVLASWLSGRNASRLTRIDQVIVAGGWKYLRSERLDGSVIEEHCFDLSNDPGASRDRLVERASECLYFPNLLADAIRRLAAGWVLVASPAAVELTAVSSNAKDALIAVRPTYASRSPIASLESGEVRWAPRSADAVLAILPGRSVEQIELERLADEEVDDVVVLESLRYAEVVELPDGRRGEGTRVQFSTRARQVEPPVPVEWLEPDLERNLRGLGYLD